MKNIKINSVVQINENGKEEWIGCLIVVSEIKNWGVQGFLKMPFKGNAYIRLNNNEFDLIGDAVMILKEETK